MPVWVLLLGGAAVVAYLATRNTAYTPTAGAYKFTTTQNAPLYASDPTLTAGQTALATLAPGTVVYGTAAGLPQFSSDGTYELVVVASTSQQGWVASANLQQTMV